MKKAIIIPIYLKLNDPEELPYAQGLRLAERAVGSLKILKDQDYTLILPVCFDLSVEQDSLLEMDMFLRGKFAVNNALIFSAIHLEQLKNHFVERNLEDLYSLIDLKGFSNIRNTGLLLAEALSADVAIFIDNDEVIEDPNYLEVACEYLNQEWNGKVVNGKGGFYINPDGTILLPPQHLWWRFMWNKTKWMNRVWENILSAEERVVLPRMLLGGNLVLHRDLFNYIPFDPFIPRGEDTDYLINAIQLGFSLLFDKKLRIRHLHPERTEAFFLEELRGDIERFLYERQKAKAGLTIDLHPYPGYFLTWTLYPKAILTSVLLSLDYLAKGEWEKGADCISPLGLLFQKRGGVWLKYLKFKADWERAMKEIRENRIDRILEECRI